MIYDLWCSKCRNSPSSAPGSDQYTGKTIGTAAMRFSNHKSDVNTGKISKAIAEHFNGPGHKTSDMRFLPFEIVRGNDPMLLTSRDF